MTVAKTPAKAPAARKAAPRRKPEPKRPTLKRQPHEAATGRRSKLSPEVQNRIVAALKGASPVITACEVAGIDIGTYFRWLGRGEAEPDTPYGAFRAAVIAAEFEAEALLAGTWMRCAVGSPAIYDQAGNLLRAEIPPNWQAIRDLLRVRHPERWTPAERLVLDASVRINNPTEQVVPDPGELVAGARKRVLELVPGRAS